VRDILIQRLPPLEIGSGLENVQLLQERIHSRSAVRGDLAAVQGDSQVRQVGFGVLEGAEVAAGLQEDLQDSEAGLHVGLAVAAAGWVPELEGGDARAGHLQVADVQDVAGFGVDVRSAVAVAEDGEDVEVRAQGHGDALGAALFVAGAHAAEDGAPGLAGLVPGRDGLVVDGADGGVGGVEVEFAGGGFLEHFAAAVAEEFVEADLDFEGFVFVFVVDVLV